MFAVTADEHVFALSGNYQPFTVDEVPSRQTVFELRVGGELPAGERTHVFTSVTDEDMPRIELCHLGDDWLIIVSRTRQSEICAYIFVSADLHTAQLVCANGDMRFGLDNACMLLYAFSTARRQTLLLHAAAVTRRGKGYLFLGHSGTGKSTHARMWLQSFSDARLLNDDNPVLRLEESGEVWVYGSPWSGKTPCYVSDQAPAGALVLLSQAPRNRLERMSLPQAYAYILSSASGMKIDPGMMDAFYHTVSRVVQAIPAYHLECLPDPSSARLLEQEL